MTNCYSYSARVLCASLLLAPTGAALAQAPIITAVIPMANAQAVARTSPITVNFNQLLTAGSARALKVFSSQRGGMRSRGIRPAVVSGNALIFAPSAYPFMPGETVQYTVTTAAASSGGALGQARAGQFTAAVGGSGRGVFGAGSTITSASAKSVAVGDVDGDGDLDLLASNGIYLNIGQGVFIASQAITPTVCIKTGDVDNDGDLDMLTTNYVANTVSVRFNNGTGTFGSSQDVPVGIGVVDVMVADVDGDGDLDLLTANQGINNSSNNTVSVRLNGGNSSGGGTGLFANGTDLALGLYPNSLAVGDVDGDGDLDLLVTDSSTDIASVCVNNSRGVFSLGQSVLVGFSARGATLADVDVDGDLDLLTVNTGRTPATASIRFNNGAGTFGGGQDVMIDNQPYDLALGDIDNDGDLDLLTANYNFRGVGTVSIRLNDGSGRFSGTLDLAVSAHLGDITLGDVDGDGDLDFIATSLDTFGDVSVYLNGGTVQATTTGHPTALTLFPNPAHGASILSGAVPNAPLTVLDALGRVLLTTTVDATGTARLVLPDGLPAGVYLVRSGGQMRRLTVEQ